MVNPHLPRFQVFTNEAKPLSDVFATNAQQAASPAQNTKFYKQVARFQVAEDAPRSERIESKGKAPLKNTDSGYHGMTEDEMEIDNEPVNFENVQSPVQMDTKVEDAAIEPAAEPATNESAPEETEADAKADNDMPTNVMAEVIVQEMEDEDMMDEDIPKEALIENLPGAFPEEMDLGEQHETEAFELPSERKPEATTKVSFEDDIGSPSEASTPGRPVVRKSSLTFASLPAREPLNTKKSMGTRVSRTSYVDAAKTSGSSSQYGRRTGGGSQNMASDPEDEELAENKASSDPPLLIREDSASQTTKLHNKSSTQRLHDKISMLGKAPPARPTKSITSFANATAKISYPELKSTKSGGSESPTEPEAVSLIREKSKDEEAPPTSRSALQRPGLLKSHTTDVMEQIHDKDSIGERDFDFPRPPPRTEASPSRSTPAPPKLGHMKSASTVTLTSPSKGTMVPGPLSKATSFPNPASSSLEGQLSTTPIGSPPARPHRDGPLSASKLKLQSIMKTAKGLFTSSAGASAAAKMETLSPPFMRPIPEFSMEDSKTHYPNINSLINSPNRMPAAPEKQLKQDEVRKTRSSTETMAREKAEKEMEKARQAQTQARQRMDMELEKAREQERKKAMVGKEKPRTAAEPKPTAHKQEARVQQESQAPKATRSSPRFPKKQEPPSEPHTDEEADMTDEISMAPPPPPSGHPKTQTQGEMKRPMKPTREPTQKTRLQPVSIRVGTLSSQRPPLASGTFGSSAQDPPAPAKQPTLLRKASNTSLQSSSSNNNLKTSTQALPPKPRALVAAERKREADEREAARKLEQKREMERRRAAAQEEARVQEQQRLEAEMRERSEREQSIAEEPKKNAQKAAIEKRRLENARKMEQQRNGQRVGDLVSIILCIIILVSDLNRIMQSSKTPRPNPQPIHLAASLDRCARPRD